MKKFLRKVSTVLLTAAMVTGMCMTSFATSAPTNPDSTPVEVTSGSTADIVVGVGALDDNTSANGGDTLLAYKVVDITYNDNKLSYEFTSDFKNFLTSGLGTQWSSLTPEKYADMVDNADEIKSLLGNFTAYVKAADNGVTATYSANDKDDPAGMDGIVIFNDAAMGQYIIVGDGTSTGAKIYQTVTAEVNPVVDNGHPVLYDSYTVSMKTSKPDITKDITSGTVQDDAITTGNQGDGDKHTEHKQTSDIGKTIDYSLKVSVPTYPEGATNKTFYVGDTLSKGLDFIPQSETENIVVKGFETADAAEGTLLAQDTAYKFETIANPPVAPETVGTTTLYITFDYDKIAEYDHVVIEYKAKLNADANIGTIDGNPNNVELIYSNSPFDGNTWEEGERPGDKPGYGKDEDMEIVYTYALVIDKFEEKHEGEKLDGAEFQIFTDEALQNPIKDAEGNVVTLTTDAGGAALYAGLAQGTYYLKEITAPEGYNLMTEAIKITIDANSIPYYTKKTTTVTHYTYTKEVNGDQATINGDLAWINDNGDVMTTADGNAPAEGGYSAAYVASSTTENTEVIEISKPGLEGENAANGFYKAGVSNNKGAHLPSTGGMGTTVFTVVGLILMLGAAILLIVRRRMSGKQ